MSRCLPLAVVLALAPGLASATPTTYAAGPGELMQRFDADGSGGVDESEYVAYLSVGFRARDTDGNGVLEGEELPPGAKPILRADNETRLRRQFARQDANANGTLDARELLAPPRG
ncbi:calcium-dependent protein kinase 21 [Silanimonas sp.]|uniref:calcium-dependent protein kinase 21 n=1 Tax=Silanimonas sp. TaxID=1929290 RepID=UPI0022BF4425|nr:calcium-dependent protein kinase 21 [Silanimonas sp.]MCZ8115715.1 calcium-dependent protein kinase 21 [Silanimonas sp.]